MRKDREKSFSAPYARLCVDPAKEIRTLTGIRPYRPAGFVLRREELAGRPLVHNYGHGGCGVTLSWGCAEMAADLVMENHPQQAAVLGGGVIGLTTAYILLKRGVEVSVYADVFSPDTTSDVAGALWFPVTLYDEAVATPEFMKQFRKAARRSYEAFLELMNQPRYGVYFMRFFEFFEEARGEGLPLRVEGDDLYPEQELISGDQAFGFPEGLRYRAMMIDPSLFLPAIMEDIREAGGQFVQSKFDHQEQLVALNEDILINCTGYGAKALFGDETMIPARGQLTLIEGQPEIDYGYALGRGESEYLYMFPRKGSIVLGGTKDMGNASLAIDERDRARMIAGHAEMAACMAKAELSKEEEAANG